MFLFVASVLVALTVSALCSLAEAVLLSLTPSQVAAKLEIDLTDPEGNLGRWLGAKQKRRYKPGQAYLEADHTFTVRRIRRGHIFDVIIQKQNPSLKA
jgi:hypothetical protein